MKTSETLTHFVSALEGEFTPEVQHWVQAGLKRFEGGESLPRALGLNSIHSKGVRFAVKRLRFEAHLRKAAELIPNGDAWTKAKVLSSEIKTMKRRWPILKNQPTPPERLNDIQKHLFNAFQTGYKGPESETGLYGILTQLSK